MPAAVNRQPAKLPLASSAQSLFHNEAKAESAQDRLNLASAAEKLIPQHLLIGWGYGIEFQYFETGTRTVENVAYAHNLVLDLWLRLGLIGLVLFALAFGVLRQGGSAGVAARSGPGGGLSRAGHRGVVDRTPRHGTPRALLDEYRFTTLFGVCLGLLRACVTSMNERPRLPKGPLAVTASRFATGGPR